jgi:hypothetical protein
LFLSLVEEANFREKKQHSDVGSGTIQTITVVVVVDMEACIHASG